MNNLRTMRKQGGFTLIELMIVIAILAILLAIAIPAYQDYTVRAKVSEALNAAAPAKLSVSEFFQTQNVLPNTADEAGFSTNFDSEFVQSVRWASDNIQVDITDQVGGDTSAGQEAFVLSPITRPDGTVNWNCKASEIPTKYLPANCRDS